MRLHQLINKYLYRFVQVLNCSILYKQIAALFFLAVFLAQTFSKGVIIADYYTYTAVYAQNCVNKARPKMHCNGKCQMMKKLKQEESRDQQNPERKSDHKNELLFFTANHFELQLFSSSIITRYPPYNNTTANEIAFDFFQPPRV
jgi:hypothetical protein